MVGQINDLIQASGTRSLVVEKVFHTRTTQYKGYMKPMNSEVWESLPRGEALVRAVQYRKRIVLIFKTGLFWTIHLGGGGYVTTSSTHEYRTNPAFRTGRVLCFCFRNIPTLLVIHSLHDGHSCPVLFTQGRVDGYKQAMSDIEIIRSIWKLTESFDVEEVPHMTKGAPRHEYFLGYFQT